MPELNRRYLRACEGLSPAIRSDWEGLLHADPVWAQNTAPGKMGELMDNVLEQLWAILEAPPEARPTRPKPRVEFPLWRDGQCRVGPLLVFLGQGKRVLELAAHQAESTLSDLASADLSGHRAELLLVYDLVIQGEIEGICGNCRDGAGCPLCGAGRHWLPV